MDVSEAKRLKQLGDENTKLKRLLADAVLEASAVRERPAKNGRARRPARRRRASSLPFRCSHQNWKLTFNPNRIIS